MKTQFRNLLSLIFILAIGLNVKGQIEWDVTEGVSTSDGNGVTVTGSRNSESKFYSKNQLCTNQDGSITFSWSNLTGNFIIGFTNEKSSASTNGNVHYYLKWNKHPYGDRIILNAGDGEKYADEASKIPQEFYYDADNKQQRVEYTYTATLKRVGDQIILTAQHQNGTNSTTFAPTEVAKKNLMLDGTFWYTGTKISGLSVDFDQPMVVTQDVQAQPQSNKIILSTINNEGSVSYNWSVPTGASASGNVANTTVAGAYKVTISDSRNACTKTRTFHHVGPAKPLSLIHDRDLAGYGENQITGGVSHPTLEGVYNGTLLQITANNKSATFESLNRMNAGEDGIVTFSFDPRETYNSRIGLTNYEASAAFNAATHYYVEWFQHPYGEEIRINVGDGIIVHDLPHFTDGHVVKNVHVQGKIQRIGNKIHVTVDVDGQENIHIEEVSEEIPGLSEKQLALDGWMYRHTSQDKYTSKFHDVNVSFGRPIEFVETIDMKNKTVHLDIEGGSEVYTAIITNKATGATTTKSVSGQSLTHEFSEAGTYSIRIHDASTGYDKDIYTRTRTFHILEFPKAIELVHDRDLAGYGTAQLTHRDLTSPFDGFNGTITQITPNNKTATFESKNRLNEFEDGAVTFTFDSRDTWKSRIGLNQYKSSSAYNINVDFYIEWYTHPYGEEIRVNVGNGIEVIEIPKYGDGSVAKDIHVACKLERIGDIIRATIDADGQTNFHEVREFEVENISTQQLVIEGYSYKHTSNLIYDAKFHNVNTTFATPIEFTNQIVMEDKKAILNITGGSESYIIETENKATGAKTSTVAGASHEVTFSEGGTYAVTVKDAKHTEGYTNDHYYRTRTIHILDFPKEISINNERALNDGGQISSPLNGTITSAEMNAKQASFESFNKLNVNEDGALLFEFDSEIYSNYHERIGFTNDLSSATYNANVHYYVEWHRHVRGCEIRVNVGNGIQIIKLESWNGSSEVRDVRVVGKIEREGDIIRATIDIDGQPVLNEETGKYELNTHKVFEHEIEGVSGKYLVVDAFTYRATREDSKSRFHNVNASFATPIDIDETIDQSTGSVNVMATGGSGTYVYEWRKDGDLISENTASVSGLAKGTYEVTVKDAKHTEGYHNDDYKATRTYHILGGQTDITLTAGSGSVTLDGEGAGDVTVGTDRSHNYFVSNEEIGAGEDATLVFNYDLRGNNSITVGLSEAGGYYASNYLVEYYIELHTHTRGDEIRIFGRQSGIPVQVISIPRYTDGHVSKKNRISCKIEKIGNQITFNVVGEGQYPFNESYTYTNDNIATRKFVVDGTKYYTSTLLEDLALRIGSIEPLVTEEVTVTPRTSCDDNFNGSASFKIVSGNNPVNWVAHKNGTQFTSGSSSVGSTVELNNLEEGSYTIDFVDAEAQTSGHPFVIEDDREFVTGDIRKTNKNCSNRPGTFEIINKGGRTLNYNWTFTNTETNEVITSNEYKPIIEEMGNYDAHVELSDANDATVCPIERGDNYTMEDIGTHKIALNITPQTCDAPAQVSMEVTGLISNDMYYYVGVIPVGTTVPIRTEAQTTLEVPAGEYQYVEIKTVNNVNGCNQNIIIDDVITPIGDERKFDMTFEPSTKNVECKFEGTADIIVSGTSDYSYTLTQGVNSSSNEKIAIKEPGTYTLGVQVTDNTGENCPIDDEIEIIIEDERKYVEVELEATEITCEDDAKVSIKPITAGNFVYTWEVKKSEESIISGSGTELALEEAGDFIMFLSITDPTEEYCDTDLELPFTVKTNGKERLTGDLVLASQMNCDQKYAEFAVENLSGAGDFSYKFTMTNDLTKMGIIRRGNPVKQSIAGDYTVLANITDASGKYCPLELEDQFKVKSVGAISIEPEFIKKDECGAFELDINAEGFEAGDDFQINVSYYNITTRDRKSITINSLPINNIELTAGRYFYLTINANNRTKDCKANYRNTWFTIANEKDVDVPVVEEGEMTCRNNSRISMTAPSSLSGYQFYWVLTGPNGFKRVTRRSRYTFTVSNEGTYISQLMMTSPEGCITVQNDEIEVDLNNTFTADILKTEDADCINENGTVAFTNISGIRNNLRDITWFVNGSQFDAGKGKKQINLAPGVYNITVNAYRWPCPLTKSEVITIEDDKENITADFEKLEDADCSDMGILGSTSITDGDDSALTYTWTVSNGENGSEKNLLIEQGQHEVTLEVTGASGCKDDITKTMNIADDCNPTNLDVLSASPCNTSFGDLGSIELQVNGGNHDFVYEMTPFFYEDEEWVKGTVITGNLVDGVATELAFPGSRRSVTNNKVAQKTTVKIYEVLNDGSVNVIINKTVKVRQRDINNCNTVDSRSADEEMELETIEGTLTDLHVYPNPTAVEVNIQFNASVENALVEIYAANGQLVKTINANGYQAQLNIEYLENGIYTYKVSTTEGFVKTGRIIKM